jgi:mannitol/fructose-specific phosphotransferase system IIA component (Ntr-type)
VKLTELIDEGHVALGVTATGPDDVLRVIAEDPAEGVGMPIGKIAAALEEREQLGSTSVGGGFAIPHCKLDGLKKVSVWLARLSGPGVDFGAADGAPVCFFFVVLSPPDQPAAHLQILSQVARILKRSEVRDALLVAGDTAEVLDIVLAAASAEGT